MAMSIVNRRGTANGKACIVWAKEHGEGGFYDCYIDDERTVAGEPRHDLYHPDQVVVSDQVAVQRQGDVPR